MKMNNLHINDGDEKLRQNFGTENPFRVDDGYFEKLHDSISSKLSSQKPVNPFQWILRPAYKPALLGLSIVAVLILMYALNPFSWDTKPEDQLLSASEPSLDSYIVGAAHDMPESSFYNFCTESFLLNQDVASGSGTEQLDLSDIEQLDNEQVIQYLENDPIALELVCIN